MIFSLKFFLKSVIKRKEQEPQFVISAPAPGGNLIRLRLHNTGEASEVFLSNIVIE